MTVTKTRTAQALLAKWIWKIPTDQTLLWSTWVSSNYIAKKSYWIVKEDVNSSYFWRRLIRLSLMVVDFVRYWKFGFGINPGCLKELYVSDVDSRHKLSETARLLNFGEMGVGISLPFFNSKQMYVMKSEGQE